VKLSCNNEPIATVVANPTKDDESFPCYPKLIVDHKVYSLTCIFHENRVRGLEFLYSRSVKISHLFYGGYLHLSPLWHESYIEHPVRNRLTHNDTLGTRYH
jgi:hypothetical protein